MNTIRYACLVGASVLASGCTIINSYTNNPLVLPESTKGLPLPEAKKDERETQKASFKVSGKRGNPDVLVLLALSGGGSRAAYFSALVMLKLQTFPDHDLLQEVDAISSVSGGSIAAAYYAISKDERVTSPALAALIAPLQDKNPFPPGTLHAAGNGTLTCSKELGPSEVQKVRDRVADPYLAARVIALCNVVSNRMWDEETVKDLMKRNYVMRWFGNWFWPWNIGRYWFTAFDRSDLMAQTLANNLYDAELTTREYTFRDLTFGDLNPERPYLLINSTNATGSDSGAISRREQFPFGSIFTFTAEDFSDRIDSDIKSYSVARAVMASAAFPLVFPNMTLRDFSPLAEPECKDAENTRGLCYRYLHVFDGGNSDNLGLATVKRVLFEAAAARRFDEFKRIVVISVDAFTRPAGTSSKFSDSRVDLFSYLLDANLVSAVDSLLQANRGNTMREFRNRVFSWEEKECDPDQRNFPERLCKTLRELKATAPLDKKAPFDKEGQLNLKDKLVFYHIGFDDVGNAEFMEMGADGNIVSMRLRERLDQIPTSLSISDADANVIEKAVQSIVKPGNDCLRAIREIVTNSYVNPTDPHERCRAVDLPR